MQAILKNYRFQLFASFLVAGFMIGVAAYAAQPSFSSEFEAAGTACPRIAKQCPDGTYVGPTGSYCEFICPGEPRPVTCAPGSLWVCPACAEGTPPDQCKCSCLNVPDECGYDPCASTVDPIKCLAPVQIVSCYDPKCNVGPCIVEIAEPTEGCNGGACGFEIQPSGSESLGPAGSTFNGDSSSADESASNATSSSFVTVDQEIILAFRQVFGRSGSASELTYWQNRDKRGQALTGAMQWHKDQGQSMPGQSLGAVAGASTADLVPLINSIFRSVYDRNPTVSENQYWLTRIVDKITEAALAGAMQYHLLNGILH